jgi:catechol 2,3-dioxygenase-like lactoylglutathione lyase family enzyme
MLISKVHLRLIVSDADRSRTFYEALLGSRASRRSASHTVFELDSPPIVLTLEWRSQDLWDSMRASGLSSTCEPAPAPSGDSGGSRREPPVESRRTTFVLVVNEPEHVGHAAIALRRAGVRLRLGDQGIEAHDPDGNTWRVSFVPTAKSRSVVAA